MIACANHQVLTVLVGASEAGEAEQVARSDAPHAAADLDALVQATIQALDDADAAELRAGRGWRLRREPQAYGGRRIESSRRGATLTYAVRGAREVVLVTSRGRRHGTVAVYAGKRLVRTVRLSAGKDVLGRLVSVTSFSRPWSGRLRVVVRTHGRPVRIEGLGVATG